MSERDRATLYLIQAFMEKLTGKKFKIYIPQPLPSSESASPKIAATPAPGTQSRAGTGTDAGTPGWGMAYDAITVREERQSLQFTAHGDVQTADGRKIRIDLRLEAAQSSSFSESVSIRAGNAVLKDPLVVSLDGNLPCLESDTFSFDIDVDGRAESIAHLASGSGFLALDRNDDGKINDGSELFGPRTGDGFVELRALDADGNGWVDEADPMFDRLRIWAAGEDGKESLVALGEAGIGAVYLGTTETPWEYKDADGGLEGALRQTGFYLRENGLSGTIHMLDLAT